MNLQSLRTLGCLNLCLRIMVLCHPKFAGQAFADQAALRAPVCSRWDSQYLGFGGPSTDQTDLGFGERSADQTAKAPKLCADISAIDANASYRKKTSLIAKCIRSAQNDHDKQICSTLTALTTTNVCDDRYPLGLFYYWAPISAFRNGEAAFNELRAHAEVGDVFDSHVIIEAKPRRNGETRFALCDVTSLSNLHGPPFYCGTVAVITDNNIWMRGADPKRIRCPSHWVTSRPTGAIDISWTIVTRRNIEAFGQAIQNMLQNELGLVAIRRNEKDENGGIGSVLLKSAAPMRDSKILPSGWRESMDYDLEIIAQGVDSLTVNGTAHILVSRLNLPSLKDYNGMDDAQISTYESALDKHTSAAIRTACKTSSEIDAGTISCD